MKLYDQFKFGNLFFIILSGIIAYLELLLLFTLLSKILSLQGLGETPSFNF